MKSKKKALLRLALCTVLIVLVTFPLVTRYQANAFKYEGLDDNNNPIIESEYKKASATAGYKYSTGTWYFSLPNSDARYEPVGYIHGEKQDLSEEDYAEGIAFAAETELIPEETTEPDASGVYKTKRRVSAQSLIEWVIKTQGIEYLHDVKGKLKFYANRVMYAYEASSGDKEQSGPLYDYEEIVNYPETAGWGVEWSGKTKEALKTMYGRKVSFSLKSAKFTIEVVDANGNLLGTDVYKKKTFTDFPYGEVFFSETLPSITYPGEIKSYDYLGYELIAEFKDKTTVELDSGSSTSTSDYLLQYELDGQNPNEKDFDLVLRFIYKGNAKVPTKTPTPTPKPTDSPNPSATPSPMPTSTPAPTPQPSTNTRATENYNYWFTTDMGYHMDWVASNSAYSLASYSGSAAGGTLPSATATKRAKSFTKGTDANGNTWYFIISGTNATNVHPAVYNGYDVNSSDVRYITELVFPSTITYSGTEYKVISIGGGTAKYHTADDNQDSSSETTFYSYGTLTGYYSYQTESETSSTYTYKYTDQEYAYGVIGNGYITSSGKNGKEYLTTGAENVARYYRNYYVYNTTLKSVTIPDTVTSINAYAFMYCQALEEIKGGANVTSIGHSAFEAGSTFTLLYSDRNIGLYDGDEETMVEFHFYNGACARFVYVYPNGTTHFECESGDVTTAHQDCSVTMEPYTQIMLNSRETSKVSQNMLVLPEFPKLKQLYARAFAKHTNLWDVVLSPTVTRIDAGTFYGCELDSITITSPTLTIADTKNKPEQTLGTGGMGEERTIIYTNPGAPVINGYGRVYPSHYIIKAGYKTYYVPNGPVDDTFVQVSDIHFYKNDFVFAQKYSGSSDCFIAIERDGTVWTKYYYNGDVINAGCIGEFDSVYDYEAITTTSYDSSSGTTQTNYAGDVFVLKNKAGDYYCLYKNKLVLLERASNIRGVSLAAWMESVYIEGADMDVDTYYHPLYYVTGADELYLYDVETDKKTLVSSGIAALSQKPEFRDGSSIYAVGVDGKVYDVVEKKKTENTNITMPAAITDYTGLQYVYRSTYGYCIVVDAEGDIWTKSNSSSWKETVLSLGKVTVTESSTSTTYINGLTVSNGTTSYKITIPTKYNQSVSITENQKSVTTVAGIDENIKYTMTKTPVGSISHHYFYLTESGKMYYKAYGAAAPVPATDVTFQSAGSYYALDEDGYIWTAVYNNATSQFQLTKKPEGPFKYQNGNLLVGADGTFHMMESDTWAGCVIEQVEGITGAQMAIGGLVMTDEGYWTYRISSSTGQMLSLDFNLTDKGSYYTAELYGNMFTYNGYEFTGWNKAANGSGTAYQPGDSLSLTSELTLYAQWKVADNVIRYDRNGGTGTMADDVYASTVTRAVLSPNRFSKEGYTFAGWNTKADGSGTSYADGATVTNLKGTLTLYAQWNKINISYNLVYMKYPFGSAGNTAWKTKTLAYDAVETIEGQPYTPTGTTVTYVINTPAGMSSTPTPLGKTSETTAAPDFDRWNLYMRDETGEYTYAYERFAQGDMVSGLTAENNATVYLYPTWEVLGSYVILPYSEADGYVLDGWCEISNGTGEIYPVYPPEDDENIGLYTPIRNITLYGIWTPVTKEITLDATNKAAQATGMSAAVTQTQTSTIFTYDTTAPSVTAPTCSRWIFMGYYTKLDANGVPTADSIKVYDTSRNADGTTAATVNGLVRTNNITGTFDAVDILYAYWVPDKYTIYLDARGATSTNHTTRIEIELNGMGESIIIPEKTGYFFQGYFTGLRGSGTKYYDEEGNFVQPWTEAEVRIFYASWIQKPLELPEEDTQPKPSLIPEQEWEGTIAGEDGKGLLYADDYNSSTGALDDLQPYQVYDTSFSQGAIPGTEQLSFRARMSSWILHYKLRRITGTDSVRIYVTVPYRTQYECSEDETLIISEQKTATYSFIVPKVWCYWEVAESGLYYPDSVIVKNAALSGKEICVKVNREMDLVGDKLPDYGVIHYDSREEHVRWEETDTDGMPMLYMALEKEEYIISDVTDKEPEVDAYLSVICRNAAIKDQQQALVRSDAFSFEENDILSDKWMEDGTGAAPKKELLPSGDEIAPVTSYLQMYLSGIMLDETTPNGSYETHAEIIYIGDEQNVGTEAEQRIVLSDINDITIHTPVVCNGIVTEGVKEKDGETCLELKDALNYFTLYVDNTGIHRMSLGYGEKDFAFALSGKSNLALDDGRYMNQVRFPFDVYVDVENNSFYPDGTWNTEGDYLLAAGKWMTTGVEYQRFYLPVTAKNGEYLIEFRSVAVNCPKENGTYQAEETTESYANLSEKNYIASDMKKLNVVSYLKDFRIASTDDFTAAKQLKEGCQALTLKKGYGFSYELYTQGEFFEENAEIKVIPKYYWESTDGRERQEVKLYRVTDILSENQRKCFAWDDEPLLLQHQNFEVIQQTFSGSGMIPVDILCVSEEDRIFFEEYVKVQTITGKEYFIKQNGFLIIQIELMVKSNENRWYIFDKWTETELARDALAEGWNYVSGDIIRYDLSKSIREDYEVGGVE